MEFGEEIRAHHLMRCSLALFEKVYGELSKMEQDAAREQADKSFSLESMVLQSPEAANVVVPQGSLDQTLADVVSRYDSEADFTADMRRNGLSLEGLREALSRELAVEAVLQLVAAGTPKVEEAKVRDYYDKHPKKFALPETRKVRYLLITINEDIEENRREAALARITELRARWDGSVESFHNLAQRNSECPSAMDGGLIGRVPRSKLYDYLDEVLFALGAGQCSEVIETENGFHLVYCEEIFPPKFISYTEAAPKIRDALQAKQRKAVQTKWVGKLMKEGVGV